MIEIYEKIIEIKKKKLRAVLCTVISSVGSTPRKAGSKMLITENEQFFGTIGGGTLENTVIEKAKELMNSYLHQLINYNLTKDLGMACGGSVEIFFEPVNRLFKLFIFGAGHIAKALVRYINDFDFDISLIDYREKIFSDWETGNYSQFNMNYSEFCNENFSDKNTFIVIITNSHTNDKEILKHYIKQDFAYLGVIGSKRKKEEIKRLFIDEKFATDEEFDKINMPIGLEIMADGPEEIAISILAEIISEKNKLIHQSNNHE